MTKPKAETVRLYPVDGVALYPWPAEPFDATPEQAAELLAYIPAPFTTKAPYLIGDRGPEFIRVDVPGVVIPNKDPSLP